MLHAGGKFGGGGYTVSGGLHGVGVSVVNALSTRLDVEVRQTGYVCRQTFDDGVPAAPLAQGEATDRDRHDGHLLGRRRHLRDHRLRLRDAARPVPADGVPQQGPDHHADRRAARATSTSASDEDADAATPTAPAAAHGRYRYDDGLVDYVKHLNASKKAEPVHPEIIDFEAEDTERQLSLEVAMQWTNAYSESVHTYANTINTHEGGTHEEGFRAAMTKLVNDFAREQEASSRRRTRTSPATTSARA